jgi:hypothetical protein
MPTTMPTLIYVTDQALINLDKLTYAAFSVLAGQPAITFHFAGNERPLTLSFTDNSARLDFLAQLGLTGENR